MRIIRCLLAVSFVVSAALTAPAVLAQPQAPAFPAVTSLWGGARHGIALKSDGTVWSWGINFSGMLGDGTVSSCGPYPFSGCTNERHIPIQVHGAGNTGSLSSISAIMGGEQHNFALKSDGTVWAWGFNGFGQLGDGTHSDRYTPVQVSGLSSATALGGRGYHSLAIRSDGTAWTWGFNTSGQLGNGTIISSSVPVQVIGLGSVLTLTGGYNFSLALLSDHTLRAWGANQYGQLGDGAAETRALTPVQVSGLISVSQVSSGWEHALALRSDGTVWAWGNNVKGELGNGTTVTSSVPIQVAGLSGMTAVSGGDCHSAALKSDGTVWTWGCNDRAQLGDASNTERHQPVQVTGLTHVTQIAARDYHNYALKDDGTVWAWGWNVNGQLGDNTTSDRNIPVQVIFLNPALFLPFVLR